MNDKMDYFIERTDDRLAQMEHKIDQLISFRAWLLGWAAAVGAIAGIIVQFILKH